MSALSFLRRFPIPRTLKVPVWAIDISDASVKYLELKESHGIIMLGAYGEEPLAPGIVQSGGRIEKVPELTLVLKKIAALHSIEYVALSLPEEQAYLFEATLPNMKEADLRSSLELDLEEHIPVPPADVVFDYEITKVPLSEKDPYELAVAALQKNIVNNYLEVCTGADLSPVSFEIEAHAVARSLIPKGAQETIMLVDLGKTRTGIAIGDNRGVFFSSTVSLGGEAITQAISRALSVSREEAEQIKVSKGVSRSRKDEDLFAGLVPVLSALKDELSRHVTFWRTHPAVDGKPRPPITRVLLAGGQANMPGLAEFLSSGLGLGVTAGNPWVNIPLGGSVPEMPYATSLRYTTTLGLALRSLL
ncbi:MAG: type IV pilus assembly protein PilM [Patescibacteria group bacterium]